MSALVGDIVRSAEWRRVRDFALGVRARPAVLAIEGEAGAGKSTLWRAGVEAAAGAGHRLLRSEPSAGEADLSFAGLSDLLAGVLPAVAADIPGPQLEALEVALLLRAPDGEPPMARAMGLGVLAALRGCASMGPVLLAIDDVHWLDQASLETLTFALRRMETGPLSVVVAARSETAADPLTVGAPPHTPGWRDLLAALPSAEIVELSPLDARQVQRLLPRAVTAAQAREVARQSRGNAFWAREIAASLDSAGNPVPPRARVLTRRLASWLSPPAAEALAVVAAAGRITVGDALAALGQLDDPAAALDAAVEAGVVEEAQDRVAAAHPLLGAAVVESLPPGRRQRIYRRLAAVASSPERIAHFLALAAGPGADPQVAAALDAAAAAAHARAANAAAGQFAAQAVRFTPPADGPALVERRIRAGELLNWAGQMDEALRYLEQLDTGRLDTPELERALPLLLDTTETVVGVAAATALITRVADAAGPDPRRRALVLALASDVVYGIRGRRRAAAAEAIGCAETAGPAANAALHRALLNLVIVRVTSAEGLDRGLLDRAAALEASLPALRLYDLADLNLGIWSRCLEDLDTARAAVKRCIARARDAGDDFALATFWSYLAATEELAGDYAAAAAAMDGLDAAARWHDWPPSPWRLEPRAQLLIAAGRLDEAVSLADEQLPDREDVSAPSRFVGECIRGSVSRWRGDAAGAARHFGRATWWADQLGWADPGVRCRADPALAEACVTLGRPDEARRIARRLAEIGERLHRPALTGDAARIDALAAAEDGDLDAAAEWARAAVAAHGSSPLRLELARSLLVLGRIERRRKARNQSRSALRQALDLATEIGHRPLMAEIEHELPRVAAARSGTELTATEQRVADLIAGGATNREAAAVLFVSVRTVETHVAAIYRKLGVRTRAELARRLPPPSAS